MLCHAAVVPIYWACSSASMSATSFIRFDGPGSPDSAGGSFRFLDRCVDVDPFSCPGSPDSVGGSFRFLDHCVDVDPFSCPGSPDSVGGSFRFLDRCVDVDPFSCTVGFGDGNNSGELSFFSCCTTPLVLRSTSSQKA